MPIYYDLEIIGGINVTGEVFAEDGYIDAFTLPDDTRIEVNRMGHVIGAYSNPRLAYVGSLVLAALQESHSITEAVERTRPYVRPDVAPAYL